MPDYRFRIYEFLDERGHSVIGEWLDVERITKRDRGHLLEKMDLLAMNGTELSGGVLHGPIKSKHNPRMQSHVYKLVIHGDKMLRPMLCKGPLDMENEFTMLLGAIEVNRVLDHDAQEAEERRAIIIADPRRRMLNGRYS